MNDNNNQEIKCKHDEYSGFCEECLIEAVKISVANMGIPDYFLCGICGCKRITVKEMEDHLVNKECQSDEIPFCRKPKC